MLKDQPKRTPAKRGFAAMDVERRREIARKGGEASHGGGRTRSTETRPTTTVG